VGFACAEPALGKAVANMGLNKQPAAA